MALILYVETFTCPKYRMSLSVVNYILSDLSGDAELQAHHFEFIYGLV